MIPIVYIDNIRVKALFLISNKLPSFPASQLPVFRDMTHPEGRAILFSVFDAELFGKLSVSQPAVSCSAGWAWKTDHENSFVFLDTSENLGGAIYLSVNG
jgi:hypothetical protein